MKALLCHNHYQQPGGEDQVFADEARLLESRGHEVVRYTRHNDDVPEMKPLDVAKRTFWNRRTYQELRNLIRRERPDVLHATNTFPLISPAAFDAARAEGVPVVQSLHNYRLLCPNVLLLRDGKICESCLGRSFAWPGILHGCYRQSRVQTAVVAAMVAAHRARKTWTTAVDRYIALSDFSRKKFIAGGLPAKKIAVKTNFVYPDPGVGGGNGGYAVVVGRLSGEKGIETLLAAWKLLPRPLPLKIVGDGPLAEIVAAAARLQPEIEWLGRRPLDDVYRLIGDAKCLVLPSICYENCPKTLLEAYAKGTPVIASRLGAMEELVVDGLTGLHFDSGNPADLASKVSAFFADPGLASDMREAARREYLEKYTADANYEQLLDIYKQAGAKTGQVFQPACHENGVLEAGLVEKPALHVSSGGPTL